MYNIEGKLMLDGSPVFSSSYGIINEEDHKYYECRATFIYVKDFLTVIFMTSRIYLFILLATNLSFMN